MAMHDKTDDFIRNRLIWKAKKYEIPSAYGHFYDDLSLGLKENLKKHITIPSAGIPVLFFTKPSKEWTLVCTRQLIGYNNHEVYAVSLKAISHVTSRVMAAMQNNKAVLSNVKGFRKTEWEELEVKDKEGSVFLFHTNKGADLFALLNVVLMVRGE